MHAAIRGLGGTVLAKGPLTLVIDEVGLFINHRTQEPTGVDAWVRLFKDGSEMPVDPHRIFINPPLIHNRIYDPRTAFEVILWQSVLNVPNPRGWRTRGTVTTVYGVTADDGVQSNDATYSTARTGSSLDTSNNINGENVAIEVQHAANSGYTITEAFIGFDTSSLPDSDTVSASVLSLKEEPGYGSFFTEADTLEARVYDWSTSVTTADWRSGTQFDALTRVATLASGSWSTSGYNDLTEDGTNFQSAINKTGTTRLVLCTTKFAAGTTPTGYSYWGIYSADNTGTTDDPKLTVTHAAAAASTRLLGLLGVGT